MAAADARRGTAREALAVDSDRFDARALLAHVLRAQPLPALLRSDQLLVGEVATLRGHLASSVFADYARFINAADRLATANSALSDVAAATAPALRAAASRASDANHNESTTTTTSSAIGDVSVPLNTATAVADDIVALVLDVGELPNSLRAALALLPTDNSLPSQVIQPLVNAIAAATGTLATLLRHVGAHDHTIAKNLFAPEPLRHVRVALADSRTLLADLAMKVVSRCLMLTNTIKPKQQMHASGALHRLLAISLSAELTAAACEPLVDSETVSNEDSVVDLLERNYIALVDVQLALRIDIVRETAATILEDLKSSKGTLSNDSQRVWGVAIQDLFNEIAFAYRTCAAVCVMIPTQNESNVLEVLDRNANRWILAAYDVVAQSVKEPLLRKLTDNALNATPFIQLSASLLSIAEIAIANVVIDVAETCFPVPRQSDTLDGRSNKQNEEDDDTQPQQEKEQIRIDEHESNNLDAARTPLSVFASLFIQKIVILQRTAFLRDIVACSVLNKISSTFRKSWISPNKKDDTSAPTSSGAVLALETFVGNVLPIALDILNATFASADILVEHLYLTTPTDSFPIRGSPLNEQQFSVLAAFVSIPSRSIQHFRTSLDHLSKGISSAVVEAISRASLLVSSPASIALDITKDKDMACTNTSDVLSRRFQQFVEFTFVQQFILSFVCQSGYNSDSIICEACKTAVSQENRKSTLYDCTCGFLFPTTSGLVDLFNAEIERISAIPKESKGEVSESSQRATLSFESLQYSTNPLIGISALQQGCTHADVQILGSLAQLCEMHVRKQLLFISNEDAIANDYSSIPKPRVLSDTIAMIQTVYQWFFVRKGTIHIALQSLNDPSKLKTSSMLGSKDPLRGNALRTKPSKFLAELYRKMTHWLSTEKETLDDILPSLITARENSSSTNGRGHTEYVALFKKQEDSQATSISGTLSYLDGSFATWINSRLCSGLAASSILWAADELSRELASSISIALFPHLFERANMDIDSMTEMVPFLLDESSATSVDVPLFLLTQFPAALDTICKSLGKSLFTQRPVKFSDGTNTSGTILTSDSEFGASTALPTVRSPSITNLVGNNSNNNNNNNVGSSQPPWILHTAPSQRSSTSSVGVTAHHRAPSATAFAATLPKSQLSLEMVGLSSTSIQQFDYLLHSISTPIAITNLKNVLLMPAIKPFTGSTNVAEQWDVNSILPITLFAAISAPLSSIDNDPDDIALFSDPNSLNRNRALSTDSHGPLSTGNNSLSLQSCSEVKLTADFQFEKILRYGPCSTIVCSAIRYVLLELRERLNDWQSENLLDILSSEDAADESGAAQWLLSGARLATLLLTIHLPLRLGYMMGPSAITETPWFTPRGGDSTIRKVFVMDSRLLLFSEEDGDVLVHAMLADGSDIQVDGTKPVDRLSSVIRDGRWKSDLLATLLALDISKVGLWS